MKLSPMALAIFYIVMGTFFTFLAVLSVRETMWNFLTISLMLFAAYDYFIAVRIILIKKKIENMNKK